jgi:flagellum-specific peptidoglycan hydrolase FlgJ
MAEFPQEVIDAALASQDEWGVPAAVTLAQWAEESGWGARMPVGSNNPFGIKAGASQPFVLVPTHEVIHGKMVEVKARFRRFDSIKDAFLYHAQLLATARAYQRAMDTDTDDEFADALTGVYATDPQYGAKLKEIMREHNLYQYDLGD